MFVTFIIGILIYKITWYWLNFLMHHAANGHILGFFANLHLPIIELGSDLIPTGFPLMIRHSEYFFATCGYSPVTPFPSHLANWCTRISLYFYYKQIPYTTYPCLRELTAMIYCPSHGDRSTLEVTWKGNRLQISWPYQVGTWRKVNLHTTPTTTQPRQNSFEFVFRSLLEHISMTLLVSR